MKTKLLSPAFYVAIAPVVTNLENDNHKAILAKVNWEKEAERCFDTLVSFFKHLNKKDLLNNNIKQIGVVDLCWNEYGGDIEVDFMPDNDVETAFDEGCIMNTAAINNDDFFKQYFSTSGEGSFKAIGRDYSEVIMFFYLMMAEIIGSVVKAPEFKSLPLKEPFYVTFSFFHDDEREVIYRG